MYRTLFDLAGIAMLGWLLVIFLPTWRVTRRVAETAVFPLFLSALYVVGIVAVFRETGPGIMREFGAADGVLRLLALESVALVAWIHILAFDQVVGLLIYRDNMKHGYVPVPLQSVLLFATLMLGPVGFVGYWLIRTARRRSAAAAWGEREALALPATEGAPRFRDVAGHGSPAAAAVRVWRAQPALTGVGMLGLALGGVCALVAAVNGGWMLGPEGRLMEAMKFDVAVGIYLLTLALLLPLAPMTGRRRRNWTLWTVGLAVFVYGMENVQAWRGLDPRFSAVAGPVDQALSGIFFLSAVGLLVLFVVLFQEFYRADALPDHPQLLLSLRYGGAAAMFAFGVGVAMSLTGTRLVGGAGNMMPTHAAGFHAIQAVPLVALLAAALPAAAARAWTHLAGVGWLMLCAGLTLQALGGRAPLDPTPALALSIAGVLAWLLAFAAVARARTGGVLAAA